MCRDTNSTVLSDLCNEHSLLIDVVSRDRERDTSAESVNTIRVHLSHISTTWMRSINIHIYLYISHIRETCIDSKTGICFCFSFLFRAIFFMRKWQKVRVEHLGKAGCYGNGVLTLAKCSAHSWREVVDSLPKSKSIRKWCIVRAFSTASGCGRTKKCVYLKLESLDKLKEHKNIDLWQMVSSFIVFFPRLLLTFRGSLLACHKLQCVGESLSRPICAAQMHV